MDNPVYLARWVLQDKKVAMVSLVPLDVKGPKATMVRKVTVAFLVHPVAQANEVFLACEVQKVNPANPAVLVTVSRASPDETENPDCPAYLDVKAKAVCRELEVHRVIR